MHMLPRTPAGSAAARRSLGDLREPRLPMTKADDYILLPATSGSRILSL